MENGLTMPNRSAPVSPTNSSSYHTQTGTPQSDSQDTPTSGTPGNGSANNNGDVGGTQTNTQPGGPNVEKRLRACDSCRGLKVRCDPNETDPNGPCKRCAKAKRECIFTAPTRKRQKKADTRVAELERKIDALTATLSRSAGGKLLPEMIAAENVVVRADHSIETPEWKDPMEYRNGDAQGAKRRRVDGIAETDSRRQSFYREIASVTGPIGSTVDDEEMELDVIDRSLLTLETADKLLDRYRDELFMHFPALPLARDMTAARFRKEKPLLFLAIIAAASSSMHVALQKELHRETLRQIAKKAVVKGEKSLEIVQAIIAIATWYLPPSHFEDINFYLLTNMATAMAVEIGLTRTTTLKVPKQECLQTPSALQGFKTKMGKTGIPMPQFFRDRGRQIFPDSRSIESRRTLIAIYCMTSNVAMCLRRPVLFRFSRYMSECCDVLESSPEALETDKILARTARVYRIAESVSTNFEIDDPRDIGRETAERMSMCIAPYTLQLDEWKANLPQICEENSALQVTYNAVVSFVQELALLTVNQKVDCFRAPWEEIDVDKPPEVKSDMRLSLVDSVSRLIGAANTMLKDYFLCASLEWIRSLPTFMHVRVTYGIVLLGKVLFYGDADTDGSMTRLFQQHNIDIEAYIDGYTDLLRRAAEGDKCYIAQKFIFVMGVIKAIRAYKKYQRSTCPAKRHGRLDPTCVCMRDGPPDCGMAREDPEPNETQTAATGPSANQSSTIARDSLNRTSRVVGIRDSVQTQTPLEMLSNAATMESPAPSTYPYDIAQSASSDTTTPNTNTNTNSIPTPSSGPYTATTPGTGGGGGSAPSAFYGGGLEDWGSGLGFDGFDWGGSLDPMMVDWSQADPLTAMVMDEVEYARSFTW